MVCPPFVRAALLAGLLLAPAALAEPTGCTEHAAGLARSCNAVDGWRGTFVGAKGGLFFAYVVQGGEKDPGAAAGAGSVAGVHVREDPKVALVAVYASSVVAFDTVAVRFTHKEEPITRDFRVDAFLLHEGLGGGGDRGVSWSARDADRDLTPEQNRVSTDTPYARADVTTFKTSVAVSALGAPVVMLAP